MSGLQVLDHSPIALDLVQNIVVSHLNYGLLWGGKQASPDKRLDNVYNLTDHCLNSHRISHPINIIASLCFPSNDR